MALPSKESIRRRTFPSKKKSGAATQGISPRLLPRNGSRSRIQVDTSGRRNANLQPECGNWRWRNGGSYPWQFFIVWDLPVFQEGTVEEIKRFRTHGHFLIAARRASEISPATTKQGEAALAPTTALFSSVTSSVTFLANALQIITSAERWLNAKFGGKVFERN